MDTKIYSSFPPLFLLYVGMKIIEVANMGWGSHSLATKLYLDTITRCNPMA